MKQKISNINSLEKALKLLLLFTEGQPQWGVREMSAHVGFSPATVQRLLKTLKAYDFVRQSAASRRYRLGNIYFRFFHALQSSYSIIQAALPVMTRLSAATRETVHLNILEGLERVTIETIESALPLKAGMPIGSRAPLYAGASAKCLLAFSAAPFRNRYVGEVHLQPFTARTIRSRNTLLKALALIREKGYAKSLGERNPGLGSLSAPIFNHDGCIMAAISLAVPEIRFKAVKRQERYLTALMKAAAEISTMAGYKKADTTGKKDAQCQQ